MVPRDKALTVAQQACQIKVTFPDFQCEQGGHWMRCIGPIRPTGISSIYTVEVFYRTNIRPEIRVLNPKLYRRTSSSLIPIPHMYEQKRLCLYYGPHLEWLKNQSIVETIIPWTSEWLYFYEIWHITGKWYGGGIHIGENGKEN